MFAMGTIDAQRLPVRQVVPAANFYLFVQRRWGAVAGMARSGRFGHRLDLWGWVLTLALALLPCLAAAAAPNQPRHETVTVQLKWFHQFQFAGFYAAIEQGYYRAAGLDVRLVAGGPDIDPAAAVAEGRADFGVGTSALIIDRDAGRDLVAVAAIFQHSPFVLAARRVPGIDGPRDLVGRRLMVESHSAELFAYLHAAGVRADQITLVPHSGNVQALREGTVDAMTAYTTTEPYDLIEGRIPYQIMNPRQYGIDFYGDTLFTSGRLAREKPELVRAFRDATIAGWRYALEHSGAVIDLIQERYQADIPRLKLEFEAEEIRRLMIAEVVDIGYMSAARWRVIGRGFVAAGLMPQSPPLDGFLFEVDTGPDERIMQATIAVAGLVILAVSLIAHRFYRLNRTLEREIQSRRRLEAELWTLASTDELTGIANRRHFIDRAAEAFAAARRDGSALALVMIDLDYFKSINDTLGHAGGDWVLRATAEALIWELRPTDLAGRLGGEEFGVIMPGLSEIDAAAAAERLRQRLTLIRPPFPGGERLAISASIGLAHAGPDDQGIYALLARGDQALYAAKAQGRNRVVDWSAVAS